MSKLSEAFKILFGKKALTRNGSMFPSYQFINGQFVGIADDRRAYITEGLNLNDVIYSIQSLITEKAKLPEWAVYKVKDESKLKKYLSLTRKKNLTGDDYKKIIQLKDESLELIQVPKLSELLKYPNSYETMQDLVSKHIGYKLITGGSCIWGETLSAGANAGKPQALHIIPYQEITIIADNKVFPFTEAGYSLTTLNLNFPKEQVLHDKYANYDFDVNGSHLYGVSPIKSALKRLSRNNSAVKASAAMFQNQGVKGILYMDDPRVLQGNYNVSDTTAQVQAVKEKLTKGEWTGESQFGRIGFSGYKLGWQDVGLSPVDLSIIESEKWDLKRFCSVWGVPAQLVGDSETSTYNNVKEAEKALTSRATMPHLVSLRNQLNRKLADDWGFKDKGFFVDFDQTCFTELQDDIGEKASWVNTLMISPNAKLNLLGLETNKEPVFDEVWIKPGDGMPLSEWEVKPDESENQNSDI